MTPRRPVVGIVTGFLRDPAYGAPGYPRLVINEDYSRSIAAAGGIPLLIPLGEDPSVIGGQLEALDGVVFSGGQDIAPWRYDALPQWASGDPEPLRDDFELAMLTQILDRGLPFLGICRGMQLLNVALGGTLVQDLASAGVTTKHQSNGLPSAPVHPVTFEPDSFLTRFTGVETARVNSFHHQAVDRVGDDLVVAATAPDGVIEALAWEGESFCAGVQWHPEMMSRTDAVAQALFAGFVDVCRG